MVARWEGGWGLGEKGEGIKKYKPLVKKQSQGCKVRHREYNTVMTMYGARWVLQILGGSLCNCIDV